MQTKTLKTITIILLVILAALSAAAIIWASRSNPEAQKQNSLASCNDLGNSVIGLNEADAIAKITHSNKPYRVVDRDTAEYYARTMDFSPDRVNLTIKQGKVASFDCN